MLLASLTAAWLRRLPFESKFRFSDLAFGPVERALSFQLDSAKQNTLIAAAECKAKLGFVPDYVAYRSQLANANREGDENAKLLALPHYWHATFYARLALQFGRS